MWCSVRDVVFYWSSLLLLSAVAVFATHVRESNTKPLCGTIRNIWNWTWTWTPFANPFLRSTSLVLDETASGAPPPSSHAQPLVCTQLLSIARNRITSWFNCYLPTEEKGRPGHCRIDQVRFISWTWSWWLWGRVSVSFSCVYWDTRQVDIMGSVKIHTQGLDYKHKKHRHISTKKKKRTLNVGAQTIRFEAMVRSSLGFARQPGPRRGAGGTLRQLVPCRGGSVRDEPPGSRQAETGGIFSLLQRGSHLQRWLAGLPGRWRHSLADVLIGLRTVMS